MLAPEMPDLDAIDRARQVHDVQELSMVAAPWSHALVGVITAVLVAFVVVGVRRYLRERLRARDANRAFDPSAPLAADARFVSGIVELARDQPLAVRVEITQVGRESRQRNGSWVHIWRETSRETLSAPFYLRRPDGERVRVEPGKNVLLVDRADRTTSLAPDRRIVRAELVPGEHVIVEGRLVQDHDPEAAGAYRDAPVGWVMQPRPEHDLHCSTEDLSARHYRYARGWRRLVVCSMLAFVTALGLFSGYGWRLFTGVDRIARVSNRVSYDWQDDHTREIHFTLDREEHRSRVDARTYRQVGNRDKVIVRDAGWATALGSGASIYIPNLVLAGFLILMVIGLGWSTVRRPWWEAPLVNYGKSRLPER